MLNTKPRRKPPDFSNPLALLASVTCSRCQRGVKLPAERYCNDCTLEIKIKHEQKLTPTLNWQLRSQESQQASYTAKRVKRLYKRFYRLNNKIIFLQAQKEHLPEKSKVIDRQISKLLLKTEEVRREYETLLNESAVADQKHSKNQSEQQPKTEKEILINQLQSLVDVAQQMVNDEQQYKS